MEGDAELQDLYREVLLDYFRSSTRKGKCDPADLRAHGINPVCGDELEITIEAVGEKGDGLAKKDGFVLFVPNTKKGDRVKVRITRVLKKVGFAEVVSQAEGGSEEPAPKQEAQEAPGDSPGQEPEPSDSGSYEDSEDFGEEENQNQ